MSDREVAELPAQVDALASAAHGTQSNTAQLPDTGPPVLPTHLQIPTRMPVATQVDPRATAHLKLSDRWKQAADNLQRMTAGESKAYGAPRVFDLFTLLAITLAFALLFALLGLLAPALDASATNLTVLISLFVAIVGVAQMWMFGANNPRLASLIGGTVAALLITCAQLMVSEYGIFEALIVAVFLSFFIGPVAGYLAGAIVAGVFLVADKLRQFYMPANRSVASRDMSFDEIQ